jgi:hypothetical protein
MPIRTNGGVFNDQMLTGSLSHWVVRGADFSGAVDQYGQPVPFSAAEIIFKNIESGAYINIMNPNKLNLSFALEEGRSIWTAESLQSMIRGLGVDVGSDHLDLSNVTVERVPYNFDINGTGGATTFLQLLDTPSTYLGSANYIVTVNPGETGLIFTPSPAVPPIQDAYSFIQVPTQQILAATGPDTLNVIPGPNITITTNSTANSLIISSTGGGGGNPSFIPIPAGSTLTLNNRYFITTAGTVTLPAINPGDAVGSTIILTKIVGIIVFINTGDVVDEIVTDIGTTDSLEYDAAQEMVLVVSSENTWELQIGSANS